MPTPPPNSRFSGLYLSGRALAVVLIVAGVAGAMAFYRIHDVPVAEWLGVTTSNQAPLADSQVAALVKQNQEQEAIAKRVAPAVVMVNVTAHASADEGGSGGIPPDNPLSQFFGQFGGNMPRRPEYEQGLGSGIIISPDGYIVTNNHVVAGATDIRVQLLDKRTYQAKVVGTDQLTDLAVIKIDAAGLPNLPWGDSKSLEQGDDVFAFGNPFGLDFTMTRGIVSGKGRVPADSRTDLRAPGDYIQTDAAINPGNSGGPLVNARGEVVGVNAFIYTSTGSFSGEAFAIPSEIARPIAATLMAKGKVVRGYLGINIVPVTPEEAHFFDLPPSATGALVSSITAGAAGAKGGLQTGDLVVSFNGQKISDPTELQLATGSVPPGTTVHLGILRDGKPMTLEVTLGIAPEDQTQPATAKPAPAPAPGVQLGVGVEDLSPTTRDRFQIPDNVQGAVITSVTPGGPAYNAGLVPGLVISDIDRVPVASADAVRNELAKIAPGQDVLIRVFQGGPQSGATFFVVHTAPGSGNGGGDNGGGR